MGWSINEHWHQNWMPMAAHAHHVKAKVKMIMLSPGNCHHWKHWWQLPGHSILLILLQSLESNSLIVSQFDCSAEALNTQRLMHALVVASIVYARCSHFWQWLSSVQPECLALNLPKIQVGRCVKVYTLTPKNGKLTEQESMENVHVKKSAWRAAIAGRLVSDMVC